MRSPASNLLSLSSLREILGEPRMAQVLLLETTDSTNLQLQALADFGKAKSGQVVLAEEQTKGRGRLGRSFASPGGMGIYLSFLILPKEKSEGRLSTVASDWTALTSCTAVAVCNAIETVAGIRPGIKWVNDLYLNDKKIAGILTQATPKPGTDALQSVVIGIGVNVLETKKDFPETLREVATSLFLETGRLCSRTNLTAAIIRELDAMCASWPSCAETWLPLYRRDSLLPGKEILVSTAEGAKKATALAIAEDYALQVRYADGEESFLHGGEVSIRPAP